MRCDVFLKVYSNENKNKHLINSLGFISFDEVGVKHSLLVDNFSIFNDLFKPRKIFLITT